MITLLTMIAAAIGGCVLLVFAALFGGALLLWLGDVLKMLTRWTARR
jgi:hypothetical protein